MESKIRFWRKVRKINGGCWEWTGTRQRYGVFYVIGNQKVRAHRFAWDLHFGPIPDGLEVLHKCDNPPCVNPEHLFLGTQQDNIDDMYRKGRQRHRGVKGEKHRLSKLSPEQVLEIRRLAGTYTIRQLGAMFGVSHATALDIIQRHTWTHI